MSAERQGRFGVVLASIASDVTLPHAAFRLYAILTSYADTDGLCWPGMETLASDLGVAERTAYEHLSVLVSRGLVRRVNRSKEGKTALTYLVDVVPPATQTPLPPAAQGQVPPAAESQVEHTRRTNQGNTTPQPRAAEAELLAKFDEFWALWPHKKDKGHARDAWKKFVAPSSERRRTHKPVAPRTIIEGLRRQLPFLQEEQKRGYCPYPATWLNGERWEDAVRDQSGTARPDPVDGLFYAEGL